MTSQDSVCACLCLCVCVCVCVHLSLCQTTGRRIRKTYVMCCLGYTLIREMLLNRLSPVFLSFCLSLPSSLYVTRSILHSKFNSREFRKENIVLHIPEVSLCLSLSISALTSIEVNLERKTKFCTFPLYQSFSLSVFLSAFRSSPLSLSLPPSLSLSLTLCFSFTPPLSQILFLHFSFTHRSSVFL